MYFGEYSILSKNIKLNCCLFVFVTNPKLFGEYWSNMKSNTIFDYRLSECNRFFLVVAEKHPASHLYTSIASSMPCFR